MNRYSSFAGKSMPMGEKIPNFSMIGVYDKEPAGIEFVKIHTNQLEGKWCVFLFMDNKASDLEIKEWQSFSYCHEEFKEMNVKVIGVCTDSHIAVRAFMHDHHLKNIKFPIISDLTGELSRSFGVLKIHNDKTGAEEFGAARAVVILNEKLEMVYLQLKNEKVASDPQDIISFLRNAKAEKAPRIPTPSTKTKVVSNLKPGQDSPSALTEPKVEEDRWSTEANFGDEKDAVTDNVSLRSNQFMFQKDKEICQKKGGELC